MGCTRFPVRSAVKRYSLLPLWPALSCMCVESLPHILLQLDLGSYEAVADHSLKTQDKFHCSVGTEMSQLSENHQPW